MNLKQFLGFQVDSVNYGIDILVVREIRRFEQPTKVPNSKEHFLGFLNLRGEVIPIIDLRVLFSSPSKSISSFTVILITNHDDKHIGYVVDSVTDVFTMETEKIQKINYANSFVLGTAAVKNGEDEKLITIINEKALCAWVSDN